MIFVNPSDDTSTRKCYYISIKHGSKSSLWILNSGASHHICHDIYLFHNICTVHRYTVTLPNKIKLHVKLIGDVRLDPILILKNVLYVPEFDMNLISISALTRRKRFAVHFKCNHALI